VSALTSEQRDAILRRHGGFIQSYFSRAGLRQARFSAVDAIPSRDQDFRDYLRLSSVLYGGARLIGLLDRILMAPAGQQVYDRATSRGAVAGRLDTQAHVRQRGKRTTIPTFPIRVVRSDHVVDENVFAVACARGLLAELQALLQRVRIPYSTETDVAGQIAHLLDLYTKDPALNQASLVAPPLESDEFQDLAERVTERWQNRRISNLAYVELLSWAREFAQPSLAQAGAFGGLVYSDEFDNRLFELFVLASVRSSLVNLGFEEVALQALHRARERPVAEFSHREAGSRLLVQYQRGSRVVWSKSAPPEWELRGVPDISLQTDSPAHPVVLIDAKNRRRASLAAADESDGAVEASEELYKMLGYFANFAKTVAVAGRGPVGGLVFQCRGEKPPLAEYNSRSGTGLLVVDAWDPLDDHLADPGGAVDEFVSRLLEWAGLLGGRRPDGYDPRDDLAEVYGLLGEEQGEDSASGDNEALVEQLEAIHKFTYTHYWDKRGPALLQAERDLEAHLLGPTWSELTEDEQQFLATGEVFWRDHRNAIGMDFGPVVIELAKAVESVLRRLLVEPCQTWATTAAKRSGKLDTLGDLRAELQRASEVHQGTENPGRGARVLDEYLGVRNLRDTAYQLVLPFVNELNGSRRAAAHPHAITSVHAEWFRSGVLGVGGATPGLARLLGQLGIAS